MPRTKVKKWEQLFLKVDILEIRFHSITRKSFFDYLRLHLSSSFSQDLKCTFKEAGFTENEKETS